MVCRQMPSAAGNERKEFPTVLPLFAQHRARPVCRRGPPHRNSGKLFHALVCKFTARDYVAGMDTRERISEMMENPEQVHELAEAVQEEGKKWLGAADEFIRRNPYLALGIALAAGCAIATLIRNRD